MSKANGNKHNKLVAMPSRIAPEKVYDYIKKLEVDGLPRIRAYAEAIDPMIYSLTPEQQTRKLDYFKLNYQGYNEIRDAVLAETKEWNLRRSATLQNKAIDLLSNLIDKANQIATDPEADAKDLNVAVSTLKSIMPAFTAIGANKANESAATVDKTKRAAEFIN